MVKNKKSQMHLSIVLFVFATLLLVIVAIVAFNVKHSNIKSEINSVQNLEEPMIKAEIFNLYLRDIISKVNSKEKAIEQFRYEMAKYKNEKGIFIYPGFVQVETQINENAGEHIKIEGDKIIADFDISMISSVYPEDVKKGRNYESLYNYKFHFEKNL